MSYADIAGIGGLIIAMITVAWNIANGKNRSNSIGMLERGQYLESVNKSIELANNRALVAEQRALKAEEDVEKSREETERIERELEERLSILERNSSYRMIFDVILGASPRVENVEITHFKERRVKDVGRSPDRRIGG